MQLIFALSSDFGYVVIVFVLVWILINWLESRVLQARLIYKVDYPRMYIEPHAHVFNCIQRAHQNTLEVYPLFLVLLVFSGLLYPRLSAASGVIWIAGRVAYALGYSTGDPGKRQYGVFGYIGLLTLLVCNIILALKMLGVVAM